LSGRLVHTCTRSGTQIRGLSWSPDGKHLVSGGAKDKVRIWDVDTGQQIFVYSGHEPPASPPTTIADPYSNFSTPVVHPPVEISAVAWSPNGDWIVSGDTAGSMHVWAAK
ncbi:MAG TPA: hypothetical protein VGN34_07115, partial [Ktedonobacteraceae bacterium]